MVFAQISDLHLTADDTFSNDDGPVAHAVACVAALNRLDPRPELVLITGDVVERANTDSYHRARRILDELQVPYFVVPGNHDDRRLLLEAFPDGACPVRDADREPYIQYTFSHSGFLFIGLDTLKPGSDHGQLCRDRLSWLEAVLHESTTVPRVVFLHHPPVATGHPVVDDTRLYHSAALHRLLQRFPAETHLLCGHVHRSVSTIWAGAALHICPSVFHQFSFDRWLEADLNFVSEPPAFRVYLRIENALLSHVVYV